MAYTTQPRDGHNCAECVHWLEIQPMGPTKDDWGDRGECHRYPPTLIGKQDTDKVLGWSEFQGAWPTTLGCDFCGEFVAASEEDAMSEEVVSAWRTTGERLKKLIAEK